MSQILLLSDLHLETPQAYEIFEIIPTAPHLALLGDIGCVKDTNYLDFIKNQLSNFQTVFLLIGNHEPYHSSWSSVKRKIRQFEKEIHETRPV